MAQVDLHDPTLWPRARQIAWIRGNFRPKYFLSFAIGGTGWLVREEAISQIEQRLARLQRLA